MLKRWFKERVQPSPKAEKVAEAIGVVKLLDTAGVLEALVPKEVVELLLDKTVPITQQEMGAFSTAIVEDAKTYTQVKDLLLKHYPNLAPKPSEDLKCEILLLLKAKETLSNLGFPVVKKIFNDCPRNGESTEFVETFLEHCKRCAEHIALLKTYCDTYYVEQQGEYLPDEGFEEVRQAIETFMQEDDTLQILQQLTKEELRLILQSQKHHKQKKQIAKDEVLPTLRVIREQAKQYVQVRNLVLQGASENDVSTKQLLQLVEKLVETKVLYKVPFSVIETMYDAFYEEHKNRRDIKYPIKQLILPFLKRCTKREKEYNTYIEGIKKYCEFYYLEKGKTKKMPKGGFPEVNKAIDTFKKDKATWEAFTRLSRYDIRDILNSEEPFQDVIVAGKVLQRLEAIRERAKQWEPQFLLTEKKGLYDGGRKASKVKLLFNRSKSKRSVKGKEENTSNIVRPVFTGKKSKGHLSVVRRVSKTSFRKGSTIRVVNNTTAGGVSARSNKVPLSDRSKKSGKASNRRKGENNNNEFDFIAAIDGDNVVKKVIYTASRKVSKILMVVPVEKKNQLLTDRVEIDNFSTSSGSETLSGRKKKGKKSKSKKKKNSQVGSPG